jgi:hypothetical protein
MIFFEILGFSVELGFEGEPHPIHHVGQLNSQGLGVPLPTKPGRFSNFVGPLQVPW